jgi:hypothetical protein
MHCIKVYAELHWAVRRPIVMFFVNGLEYIHSTDIISSRLYQENVIFTIPVDKFLAENSLEIKMSDKTNDLITAESDHWVDIKNIFIDDIAADEILSRTRFRHTMPESWVQEMKQQGHFIQREYIPGTSMRLNGVCTFDFTVPFVYEKILHLWNLY